MFARQVRIATGNERELGGGVLLPKRVVAERLMGWWDRIWVDEGVEDV